MAGWSRTADATTCEVSKQLGQTTCAVRVHWRQSTTLHFGKPVNDAYGLPDGKPFTHLGVAGEFVLIKPRRYQIPPMPTALSVDLGDMVIAVEITFAKSDEAIPAVVQVVDVDLKARFAARVAAAVEAQRQTLQAEYDAKHRELAKARAELEATIRTRTMDSIFDAVERHVAVKTVRGLGRTDSGVIATIQRIVELGSFHIVVLRLEHRRRRGRVAVHRATLYHEGKPHAVHARLPRVVTGDAARTAMVGIEKQAAWRGERLTLRLLLGKEWLDVPLQL